ncbi:MAG TPA: pitrilysin family protein [Thermodesulfovibrionales bacterium]|nr:pitrilysin family protein [Thermodesulfovibrionales bacterium]
MRSVKLIKQTRLSVLFLLSLFIIYFSLSTAVQAIDIKRSVLPNGLTVLHVERHNLPIVMVTLLVKAGPPDETPARAGLANLTADLLNEGTKKRKAVDISEDIDFIGASLGASADSDYTTVSLSVLKKDVEKGFEIFSDIILNPLFPDEEIKRVKELVKGSLRQSEEEPSFLATRAFKKAVYGDLPYGRLVSGSIETIDALKREDIAGFHTAYYKPNNSFLSVVGDLTEDELRSLLRKYLEGWKQAEIPKRQPLQEPRKKRENIQIDRDLTQANILIGHAGISRVNPDYYAVSVMNYVLGGGGFSSRLMQMVREERGLAYDIHSHFAPFKEGGLFEVGVQTKNQSANTVIGLVNEQIGRIRKERVSDQELEDAKAYLTGSFPRRLDTNRKIADFLVVAEFYGLGVDYVDKYPGYVNSVTADDVSRVAGKYLDPAGLVTVVVGRQSEISLKNE